MKHDNDAVVCKQCGKIIVGSSKLGLCESCAKKDTGYALVIIAALETTRRTVKKLLPMIKENAPKLLKLLKK